MQINSMISELIYSDTALKEKLKAYEKIEGSEYITQMWNYALDSGTYKKFKIIKNERNDAIPYMPIDPETLGIDINKNSRVLDIGCLGGYGLFNFALNRKRSGLQVPHLTGIDINSLSIKIAVEMAELWGKDLSVTFYEAGIEKLPFDLLSFDLVIARLVLPYVNVPSAISEVSRVLKPNGIVVFQTHSFSYYWDAFIRNLSSPFVGCYYLKSIISGMLFVTTGRQIRHRWFSEVAMNSVLLRKLCITFNLFPVWMGGYSRKPIMVLKKR